MKRILEYLLDKNTKLKESEVEAHEDDLFSPKHQRNTYADFIDWFWKALKYYDNFSDEKIKHLKKWLSFYSNGSIKLDTEDHYLNWAKNDFQNKELTFKEGYDIVIDFLNEYKNFW